jgi:hypothetical protein
MNLQGLDLATIRSQDPAFARDHGEFIGTDFYAGRDFSADLWMKSNGVSLQSSQLILAGALLDGLNTELPFWFKLPNLQVMAIMARARKRPMTYDSDYAAAQIGKPKVTWHATDPRIYSGGNANTLTLGAPAGGLTFPVGPFPVTFGGTTPNSVTLNNLGNTEMRPIVVFTGPLTNPWIQNISIAGSPRLTFVNPAETTFTVLAGDQLLVDLSPNHNVLYYVGGVGAGSPQPVEGWLTFGSVWWDLMAGNNTIQFGSGDGVDTGGTAQIQWASAWQL